jgi:hypothetical protein
MLIIPTPRRRRRNRTPAPPTVASANGTQAVRLTFDQPTFVVDAIPPGAFVSGAGQATNWNQLDDYTIEVTFQDTTPPGDDVWQVFPGDSFTVSDQSWLDRPDALPASGTFGGYPLPDVTVDVVGHWDSTTVNVVFSNYVSIIRSAIPDSALSVDLQPVTGIPLLGGGNILVNVTGAGSATNWSLVGQPAWLRNRVSFPTGGVVEP